MSAPLLPQHQALIDASGISPEVAAQRGYRSVTDPAELERLGFAPEQRQVPTLLVPRRTVYGTDGPPQHRPDHPRKIKGKVVKYETPKGSRTVLDVPAGAQATLRDPTIPLGITEGSRKADSAVSRGHCYISLAGVWNWKGKNEKGGLTTLADWDSVALNQRMIYLTFDSDVMTKRSVGVALDRFRKFLTAKGAAIVYVLRIPPGPNGQKQGLDDYLAGGGSLDALIAAAQTEEDFTPPVAKLTEELNDKGNGRRFARAYQGMVGYSGNLGTWLKYEATVTPDGIGGAWVPDLDEAHVMQLAKALTDTWWDEAKTLGEEEQKKLRKHAFECGAAHRLSAMVKMARTEPSMRLDITTFDQDDWQLNCPNGVLDLRTGSLRPSLPTDRCRLQMAVAFDPTATDATFTRMLDEDLPNPQTRAFWQEVNGYMLTGDRRAEVMLAPHGPPRSGKTIGAEIPRRAMGGYADTVPADVFMRVRRDNAGEANRPMLAKLFGKRLVTSPETDKQHVFDVALINQVTGGDPVSACAKYEDPFEYVPKFLWVLYGNRRPKADFDEDALRRRLIEIPFRIGHTEAEADEEMKRYLLNDPRALRAWFAWAYAGLRRLMANKMKLVKPPEVVAATAEYWQAQNVLGPFLSTLVFEPDAFVSSAVMRTQFEGWCEDTGTKASMADLYKALVGKGCENGTGRPVVGGATVRGWHGVRLDRHTDTPVTPVSGKPPLRVSQEYFPGSGVSGRVGVSVVVPLKRGPQR